MENILIIEDDNKLSRELKGLLEIKNYSVIVLNNLNCQKINLEDINLIISDTNIKSNNIFKNEFNIPIIFLVKENEIIDENIKNSLYDYDFVKKPFNPNILFTKIEILLKNNLQESVINYKGFILDLKLDIGRYNGKKTKFTKSEKLILDYLIKNSGRYIKRSDLINYLWENEYSVDEDTLSIHILRIRKKLKELGLENFIKTKKDIGYII